MVPFRSMLVFLILATQAYASEFTVDEWNLASGIIGPGSGDIVGTSFNQVLNPFADSQHVELGVSSASASYDFGWDETGGHFSIQSQTAAELVSGGSNRASTHGRIWITPSVDLAFHIDSTMDFDLPAQVMKAVMDVNVTSIPPWTLYDGHRRHDTFSDGTGSGTLSSGGDFIMPAGRTWRLGYDLYVDTYDYEPIPGSAGEIGTATSSVNVSFTVLPEPSTFGLLAMSLLLLRHKRKPQAPPTAKTPS